MKVTAKVVTLNGGVTARWLDGNNYYRLDIEDDKMVAYRTAGGVLATMGGPYPRPAIGDTIALQVSGATVTAYINDVLVGAKVDPSPLPSGTSAGLRSAATATTEFDDFLVTNF